MVHTNLLGLSLAELEEFVGGLGEKKFRARQIYQWLYQRRAVSFAGMSSLSASFRRILDSTAVIGTLTLLRQQTSRSDGTTKLLFECGDGRKIESVLIPARSGFDRPEAGDDDSRRRLTLCVSTQVGCPLDCAFCATATMGFLRNLTSGEIISQVLEAERITGQPVTNLVYMGMGEPLLNYDEVMKSIGIIIDGLNIAARRITVSTAGWVPGIRRMADEDKKVKLAISLHTPVQDARRELMPVAAKFPLDELLKSAGYYYRITKRRVTFEYILFDGWNDREEDCRRLAVIARQIPSKINIIPFHDIAFTGREGPAAALHPTPPDRIEEFAARLRKEHCTVFVRSSAGKDIDAACGQLAVKTERRRHSHTAIRQP